MTARSRGEGSVYWDAKHGRYVGKLTDHTNAAGKRVRGRKVSAKTKREAERKLRDLQREHDAGRPVASATLTVAEVCRGFMDKELDVNTNNAAANVRWAMESHVIPALGTTRVRDLTPNDVHAMLRKRADDGLSTSSIRRIHQELKRALRWAESWDMLGRNVAEKVKPPKGTVKESRAMTAEQARRFLDAAAGSRYEALFRLGLTVPSRPGELAGLCWDCIDWERNVVHFRRALHKDIDTGRVYLDKLKTPQSRRSIEVTSDVMQALRRRWHEQEVERVAPARQWRQWTTTGDGLVFTTRYGTPLYTHKLRKLTATAAARAGLPGEWTTRELRQTAVSALSDAGVNVEDIADAAGHRNAVVTQVVYRKQLNPVVRSVRSAMQGRYEGPESPPESRNAAEDEGTIGYDSEAS